MRAYNDRTPHRLMPLTSRHTRSRRRWQHALDNPGGSEPPPPAADYIVSGDGDPSPNGEYNLNGQYNGYDVITRDDDAWSLWWADWSESYVLTPAVGNWDILWQLYGTDPIGTYTPVVNCTGEPVVAAA